MYLAYHCPLSPYMLDIVRIFHDMCYPFLSEKYTEVCKQHTSTTVMVYASTCMLLGPCKQSRITVFVTKWHVVKKNQLS